MSDALLSIEGITAGYDQAAVVRDLNVTVGAGEVVSLLGANGAGKTTTLRVISGIVKPLLGTRRLRRKDLAPVSPSARARLGIAHVPEGRGIFFGLTVAEHFRLVHRGERLDEEIAYEYFPLLRELRADAHRAALRRRAADARGRARAGPPSTTAAARRAEPRSRARDRRAPAAGRAPVRARLGVRRPARRAARASRARDRRPRLRPLARGDRAAEQGRRASRRPQLLVASYLGERAVAASAPNAATRGGQPVRDRGRVLCELEPNTMML